MLSIDRVLEYNDTNGNGQFDESADSVISYYGAYMPSLAPNYRNLTWHGDFAWRRGVAGDDVINKNDVTNSSRKHHADAVDSASLNVSTLPISSVMQRGSFVAKIKHNAQVDDDDFIRVGVSCRVVSCRVVVVFA